MSTREVVFFGSLLAFVIYQLFVVIELLKK